MTAIKITIYLFVAALGAATWSWTVQYDSLPRAAILAKANATVPQDVESATSKSADGDGQKLMVLTTGLQGFQVPCVGCHMQLSSPLEDPVKRGRGPHKNVVLKHGANDRCFNCHNPRGDKYGSFVRHDGSEISVEHVEELCHKCHGPHYRHWKNGAHGQRSGYWNLDLGRQVTAHCNSCHDPHQPVIKPVATMPKPQPLRGKTPTPDHPCWTSHGHD